VAKLVRLAVYSSTAARVLRVSAYSTEFAEAFRPIISRVKVQVLYAITYAYIAGSLVNRVITAQRTGASAKFVIRELSMETIIQGFLNFWLPVTVVHFVVHQAQNVGNALKLTGAIKVIIDEILSHTERVNEAKTSSYTFLCCCMVLCVYVCILSALGANASGAELNTALSGAGFACGAPH